MSGGTVCKSGARSVGRWPIVLGFAIVIWDLAYVSFLDQFIFRDAVTLWEWYGVRFAFVFGMALVSVCSGFATRQSIGLMLGDLRLAGHCIALVVAWLTSLVLILSAVAIVIVRSTGALLPIEPTDLRTPEHLPQQIVVLCLLAPVIEESVYRGFLVSSLNTAVGRRTALFGSGVVFAAYHVMSRPIWAAPQYFLVGIVLAWAFQRSGGLIAPICLHALGNFFVITRDVLILCYPEWFERLLGYS